MRPEHFSSTPRSSSASTSPTAETRTGPSVESASRVSTERPKALSLRSNYSWTFLGNIAYGASQWAMLTLLAKSGSTETVGLFVLGLSITAPIMLAGFCQLRSVVVQDQVNAYRASDYFRFWTVSGLVAVVATCLVGTVCYDVSVAIILLLFALVRLVEFYSEIIYGYFQKHEAMNYVTWFRVLQGGTGLVCFASVIVAGGGLLAALAALIACRAAMLLLVEIRSFRRCGAGTGEEASSHGKLGRLALLVIPLGLATLMTSSSANAPRFFIETYEGLDSLAYFGAASYVVLISNTMIQALSTVILPRLTRHVAQAERGPFQSLLTKSVGVGLAIGLAALAISALAGKQLLTWFYTSDYAAYSHVFVILVGATVFNNAAFFLRSAIIAFGAFRRHMALDAAVLISVLVASFVLIPTYGILGAAYVVVLSQVVNALGAFGIVMRLVNQRLRPTPVASHDTA